jgi:hypothetical protein
MNKDTSMAKLMKFICQVLPDLRLDAGRTGREMLWMSQEFSPVAIIPPCFSMLIDYIIWVMNNSPSLATVHRHSLTPSTRL